MAKATPLRAVLAAGLRSVRADLGLRQEDAAARIQAQGLASWIRGTVAQAEVGARRLTLEEVLLLSLAYEVTPAALITAEDDELVELAPQAYVPARTLRALLSGTVVTHSVASGSARGGTSDIGDAERHAARRLGITPDELGEAAMSRWGRCLAEERDERVRQRGGSEATPRQLQALRGHATRELLGELALDIRQATARPAKRRTRQESQT